MIHRALQDAMPGYSLATHPRAASTGLRYCAACVSRYTSCSGTFIRRNALRLLRPTVRWLGGYPR